MNNKAVSPTFQYVALCQTKSGGNKLILFTLPKDYRQDNCAGAAELWFLNYGKDPKGEITTYAWGQPADVDTVFPLEDLVPFVFAEKSDVTSPVST